MADAAHPHVVLVGLSGTGKTSIGRLTAQRLGMPFVDTDEGIEARRGRTVREVFAEDGESRFPGDRGRRDRRGARCRRARQSSPRAAARS